MTVSGKACKDVPTFGMTRVRRFAARLEVRENEGRAVFSEPLLGQWHCCLRWGRLEEEWVSESRNAPWNSRCLFWTDDVRRKPTKHPSELAGVTGHVRMGLSGDAQALASADSLTNELSLAVSTWRSPGRAQSRPLEKKDNKDTSPACSLFTVQKRHWLYERGAEENEFFKEK